MAEHKSNKTIFQRLNSVMIGTTGNGNLETQHKIASYTLSPKAKSDEVLYSFTNQQDRDRKLLQLKQEKMLAYQWQKISYDSNVNTLVGLPQVRVMYRDADLMDAFPDINAALHIISEEATTLDEKGTMLHVYSKSPRVKAILEDLFENRLDGNVILPMIARSLVKYGNEFMYLNIDSNNGVIGWKEMNVHEMTRIENGQTSMYSNGNIYAGQRNMNPNDVKFVWEGHNESMPFQSWQMAHFRLIKDSQYLPYGVSHMNGARRHWRMLSMMEDGMLLYRLERSVERRIFKVNVGLIDDADVPAFLQEFMNTIKRAPVIDPQTGQIDLRKNFLDVSADYVIPVRPGQDPTDIENLQPAQNQTAMDDIKYIENKILAILRVPKSFLNYQEAQGGKGQNLSLIDIRFNRMVNYIQQSLLMELNKIAIVHLYLLGFVDELTNFTLSLNNPSNQIEMMALENLNKRIGVASAALAEQGGGIPLMSWHQVQREIMGKNDDEIMDILNEIRIETALAAELQKTTQIIKRTGIFDKTDRIYGEQGAEYQETPQEGEGGPMGGGFGGGGGGANFGDGLEGMGGPEFGGGSIGGEEGSQSLGDMGGGPQEESGAPQPLQEIERKSTKNLFFEMYKKDILKDRKTLEHKRPQIISENLIINENITNVLSELEQLENNQTDIIEMEDEDDIMD